MSRSRTRKAAADPPSAPPNQRARDRAAQVSDILDQLDAEDTRLPRGGQQTHRTVQLELPEDLLRDIERAARCNTRGGNAQSLSRFVEQALRRTLTDPSDDC